MKKWRIRHALRGRLVTLSGLPDVNWEGMEFTPSQDNDDNLNVYLQETLIVNDERVQNIKERRTTGTYLIEVFDRTDGTQGEDIAESVKDHFAVGTHLNGVTIQRAFVGQFEPRPPWTVIPVQIDFRAFDIAQVGPLNVVTYNDIQVTYNSEFVTHA